jgi:diadenosine tetraphosphatase ApaH/serine/threonine PP2A family protein phosphatase
VLSHAKQELHRERIWKSFDLREGAITSLSVREKVGELRNDFCEGEGLAGDIIAIPPVLDERDIREYLGGGSDHGAMIPPESYQSTRLEIWGLSRRGQPFAGCCAETRAAPNFYFGFAKG